MYRIVSVVVITMMILWLPMNAIGQAQRYRLQTGTSRESSAPSPSFRTPYDQGASQQGQGAMPSMMPGRAPTGSDSQVGGAGMVNAVYNVHVLGEVNGPGTYVVPASARVAQAVQRAGGLGLNASERNIELRRGGKTIRVDLLKFRQDGKLRNNPYLTDNDVVFVPLREKVVRIVGAVKRPELYELKNEDNLAAVIHLAGGFNNAVAKKEPIRVIRFVDGEKRVDEVDNSTTAMKNYALLSGDVIIVPNVITKDIEFDYNLETIPGDQVFYPSYEDRVFVLGGVAFPGAYPFSPYYTVSQYITLAGGLNDRGKEKYRLTPIGGKSRKTNPGERVNPGDTISVQQAWMTPAAWMGFALGIASFGLSASATIIALRR